MGGEFLSLATDSDPHSPLIVFGPGTLPGARIVSACSSSDRTPEVAEFWTNGRGLTPWSNRLPRNSAILSSGQNVASVVQWRPPARSSANRQDVVDSRKPTAPEAAGVYTLPFPLQAVQEIRRRPLP
jgi:hypothetical protein